MSTVQAPLLWVPLKTTSDVSYAPSIRQTITQTYQESPDAYKDEISALDRCRQDALRGSAGSDTTGRDLLYKYFGQLELLELRFPEVRVPFPWKDAFTGKEISQLSLAYEKASVIFNIAATLSSLAAQQNRTSTEGIRRAFHNFRCAAGMFTYINDNFLHAPSTDLSREVVKVLVQLMIAQATEVFIERMTEEKEKKPFGLRARVSTQAAFLYGAVIEDVKELASKGIFERSWTSLVQCKHKYFVSLAQYQRSLADSASSKHGEALTRLQIAETAAKEASRFATTFSASFSPSSGSGSVTLPSDAATSLLELTKTHLALCNEAKVSEQRDNDLIYHDAQPTEAALPPIEKSSVGDPIAIQEVYGAPEVQKVVGQDIFVRLVPLSVHQSSSLYSEEKAKLIRTEGERCETADTELVTALEFVGLPSSLDKFNDFINNGSTRLQEMCQPGKDVFDWAEAVQRAKTIKPIEKLWEELLGIRSKVHQDIENIERKLETDTRDCEQMRVQYDHLWEQQPTSQFSKTWRLNLKSHRETLEMAKNSDNQLEEMWQSTKSDIEILADPTGESLRRLFAEGANPQNNQSTSSLLDVIDSNDEESEITSMKNMITAIQENISRLQAIKKERHGVLQDLKERVQADDISQLLILNRKAQNVEPALFAAELEKFQAHSGRISATLHLQTTAIQELTAHYKSLVESRRGKEVQERWANVSKKTAQVTNRLRAAYQSHEEVCSGLSKGIQFYHEIQAAVADVQRQVESFVADRQAERIRMAARAEAERDRKAAGHGATLSLDHQMSRMNLSNPSVPSPPATGSAPPPLPPPPRAWQATTSAGPAGGVHQSFSPYPSGADRTSVPATQDRFPSTSPSADPYASLGSFGSMFSSTMPVSQNPSYSNQGQPAPPVSQQNSGLAQPLAIQYSGQAAQPLAPQHYSGPAQAPIGSQYSQQAQPLVPQHYSSQPPPPSSSVPQQHSGQMYNQLGSFQAAAPNESLPSSGLAKPALPPPPPPVTYQSVVTATHNNHHQAHSPLPPPPPPPHQHLSQQSLPASAPQMHYSFPPSQSQPAVIPPSQQYHPPNSLQSYMPPPSNHHFRPNGPSLNPSPLPPTHNQPYYDLRDGMPYGSANPNPPLPPKTDPAHLNRAGWQQGQQYPDPNIPPQNPYYPHSAHPPPPPPSQPSRSRSGYS